MTATSTDVARLAGVSRATVSYVVNNGPRPVSEETRARVIAAIQKIGYRPNELARNLRTNRTFTLGLIVPDTHNSYFSEVARGIENIAFEQGYTVFLCHSGSNLNREMQYVNMLQAQRVAGVIWIPGTIDFTPYHKLKEYGVPAVVIDRLVPDEVVPAVVADNYQGGFLATTHLIELGHKRIGFIRRHVDMSHSQGRYDGYLSALRAHSIEIDDNLVVKGGFTLDDGRRAVKTLLELRNPPTAVFAYNDTMAIGGLRAAHEAGLDVPNDLSIVGFDNIALSGFTCPALTTVHLPKFEMGQHGTKLLISLIEKKQSPGDLLTPLGVKLIVRESSSVPPNRVPKKE
jgi:DNA-binding LacI/PurR family transcriptional regulator